MPLEDVLIYNLLLFLTIMASGIPEDQYCAARYRRLCQGKGRHIGCQFPDPGPGTSCERYRQIIFTNDLKHFILHFINRRRQHIAIGNERVRGGLYLPKPQIMMLVGWDRELAQLAQRLADQCFFVHDDCRATVKYPYAGQTVGEVRWRKSSGSDELSVLRAIRRVLEAWWGEKRRVQPKQLTSPFRLYARGTTWGHFSQLAVWNLQAVGCGAVRHGSRHPRLLLVCDFSHTNMLGQRTLVPGPMSPCPIHTARSPHGAYPALCEPVRDTVHNQDETELDSNYEDGDHDYAEIDKDITKLTIPHLKKTVQIMKSESEEDNVGQDETRIFRNEESFSLPSQNQYLSQNKHTDSSIKQWRKYEEDPSDMDNEDVVEEPADHQPTSQARLETTHHPMSEDESLKTLSSRSRWKQTRFRPPRPGANALLLTATAKINSKKPNVNSLNFDADDMEQLFLDTGFNLRERKQCTLQQPLT